MPILSAIALYLPVIISLSSLTVTDQAESIDFISLEQRSTANGALQIRSTPQLAGIPNPLNPQLAGLPQCISTVARWVWLSGHLPHVDNPPRRSYGWELWASIDIGLWLSMLGYDAQPEADVYTNPQEHCDLEFSVNNHCLIEFKAYNRNIDIAEYFINLDRDGNKLQGVLPRYRFLFETPQGVQGTQRYVVGIGARDALIEALRDLLRDQRRRNDINEGNYLARLNGAWSRYQHREITSGDGRTTFIVSWAEVIRNRIAVIRNHEEELEQAGNVLNRLIDTPAELQVDIRPTEGRS